MDEHSNYMDFYKEFGRKLSNYDQDYCNLAFEEIYSRIVKDKKRKRIRKRIDALRSVMKRLEPAIQLSDSFEQVCARLVDIPEFTLLAEDEKHIAYDKFMYRLNEKINGDDRKYRRDSRERKRRRSRSSERSRKSESEDDDRKRRKDAKKIQSESEEEGELR